MPCGVKVRLWGEACATDSESWGGEPCATDSDSWSGEAVCIGGALPPLMQLLVLFKVGGCKGVEVSVSGWNEWVLSCRGEE
jgi:hypothetical protein